jgi:hypothetical protein
MRATVIALLCLTFAVSAEAGDNPDINIFLEFDNGQNYIEPAPFTVVNVTVYLENFGSGGGVTAIALMLSRSFGATLISHGPLPASWLQIGDPETGWTLAGPCAVPDGSGRVAIAQVSYFYDGTPGTLEIVDDPTYGREVIDCYSLTDYWCVRLDPSGHGGVSVAPPPGDCPADLPACGNAGGFEIDAEMYSGNWTDPGDDWAHGPDYDGVIFNNGIPDMLNHSPVAWKRDDISLAALNDSTVFYGSNKNNDNIELGSPDVWQWDVGDVVYKDDLTDLYAHIRIVGDAPDEHAWLLMGSGRLDTEGDSHIDFEWNLAGLTQSMAGGPPWTIYGNGPDCGRTALKDCIISLDFMNGGRDWVASVRRWESDGLGGFEYAQIPTTDDEVFACVSQDSILAPPWGGVDVIGTVVYPPGEISERLFAEVGIDLTALGLLTPEEAAALCGGTPTLIFKTRSSASFLADLKDFGLVPLNFPGPECGITGPTHVCLEDAVDMTYQLDDCGLFVVDPATCSWQLTVNTAGATIDDVTDCVATVNAMFEGFFIIQATYEDVNGCAGAAAETVMVDAEPLCYVSGPSYAEPEDLPVQLCGSANMYGHPYEYTWTGPEWPGPYVTTSPDSCVTVSESGTYTLEVRDLYTGCLSDLCTHELVVGGPPSITHVDDVGNDQGRNVRLVWLRSSCDTTGATYQVTSYEVHRRQDANRDGEGKGPGSESTVDGLDGHARIEGWDYVSTVPAHGDDVYQTVAPTLCDSTAEGGVCWSVFLVRAATADPCVYFDSAPDSGYSIDNLAPAPPAGLLADGDESLVTLTWDPSEDGDFDYFAVYRDLDPEFEPGDPIGYTSETTFDDTDPPYAPDWWYKVTAFDFGGNESEPSEEAGVVATIAPEAIPSRFWLGPAVPTPFPATTQIQYWVPAGEERCTVRLTVYDALGRVVRRLVDGAVSPGSHVATWDGRDDDGAPVASGVYFYSMEAGDYTNRRKAVLLR